MKKTPMNEIVINNENITQIEIISENMMDTEFEETEGKILQRIVIKKDAFGYTTYEMFPGYSSIKQDRLLDITSDLADELSENLIDFARSYKLYKECFMQAESLNSGNWKINFYINDDCLFVCKGDDIFDTYENGNVPTDCAEYEICCKKATNISRFIRKLAGENLWVLIAE